MVEVIGVRFREVGKIYYFSPGKDVLVVGTRVIVETARGLECGTVVISNREVGEENLSLSNLQKQNKRTWTGNEINFLRIYI